MSIAKTTPGGFMKSLNMGNEGSGDVSAALARLNFGVEDLTRQLKGEVSFSCCRWSVVVLIQPTGESGGRLFTSFSGACL